MSDNQLIIYSSLVFQWVVFAAVLVFLGFYIKKKIDGLTNKINMFSVDLDKKINSVNIELEQLDGQLESVLQEANELEKTLKTQNINIENVENSISSIADKVTEINTSILKFKNNLKSKFKK